MEVAAIDPLADDPQAAYVHVPFCVHRCGYCDFTLVAGRDDLIPAYLAALETELRSLGEPRTVRTLFLGGGTPTHLPPDELERLLALVRRWFPLDAAYEVFESLEFSVEANPADLSDEKIAVLTAAGVNRVSLGAQSFDADVLRTLERDHAPQRIADVVGRLRRQGIGNVSLDLIFAVPGQTLRSWRETLRRAIELEPTHVSTYGLTFEKGTAFWTRLQKGQIARLPDETERAMYAAAMDDLAAAGFEQYEVSNHARPGFRCRHNLVYWRGEPYYGFGPGAARYIGGRRETNHRSVFTWTRRVQAGESPVMDAEELAPEDRARELLVLGLRMTDGIDLNAFRERTAYDVETLAGEVVRRHTEAGLLETVNGRLRLTREGRFVADGVIVDLL